MNFFDHLIKADDDAAMLALPELTAYVRDDDEGHSFVDPSISCPVRIYMVTGTETVDDGMGGTMEQETRAYEPYAYLCLSLPEASAELQASEACLMISDRSKRPADMYSSYDHLVMCRMPKESLADYHIEGMPAV